MTRTRERKFQIRDLLRYNVGEKKRIWELDIIRGILMLMVTLDHTCQFGLNLGIFDFTTEFGMAIRSFAEAYCNSDFRIGIQPFALFLFSYLSGVNCSFAKSKFRRVLKMWIIAGIFMGGYAILHLIIPDFIVDFLIFNIIAVITICVTVWWLFDLVRLPTWVRLGISIIAICIGLTYYYKYFVLGASYVENEFLALLVYNTHGYEMSTNNFEPLLPHLGWFILGGVMGKYLYKERKTLTKHAEPYVIFRPLAYIGKHSLVVYLLGTVIILAIILGIKCLVQACL